MSWQWVNNLLDTNKKKNYWEARCPYHLCPSNQPFRNAHKPRLKFMQKVSPLIHQYKCNDCGCLTNFDLEQHDNNEDIKKMNPALWGRKADYKFYV